jgi:hypothetical protein
LFSCYLLHKKANTYIHANELSNYFIQAFPAVLSREEKDPAMELEQLARKGFCLRFIERFCEYFGLVTICREERLSSYPDYSVKTSLLFKKLFRWK